MSLLTALVALAADPVPPSSSSGPGPGGASARHHHNQGQPFTGWPLGDLEAPGALLAAAASLARRAANGDKELIFMATGSDANSLSVTNNSLVTLATLGLRRHVMLLADGWQTCEVLRAVLYGPCFWSSRMLRRQPADSITLRKFWDFRFRFYYIKKKYMALLVEGGYAVLQADTDTVWMHDPFRMLRLMRDASLVIMRDVGIANAGVVYARPGSMSALRLLDEVAWRVQLLQNHPEIVARIVPFARPPYYANSDDQSLLNDAIVSAVLRNRTFLGSTARYEGRNKYNPAGPDWASQPEAQAHKEQLRAMWKLQKRSSVVCPWAGAVGTSSRASYVRLPIRGGDAVALAPRSLFAHLPYSAGNAITHLTAARGFAAKVATLRKMAKWDPLGSQVDAPAKVDPGAAEAEQAADAAAAAKWEKNAQEKRNATRLRERIIQREKRNAHTPSRPVGESKRFAHHAKQHEESPLTETPPVGAGGKAGGKKSRGGGGRRMLH